MNNLLLQEELRPTRADAVKNRELLLKTARQLFAEQGVEHVSMSAIADAAGVGKGTLYRHFTDKADLCHALLDHEQRELQERTLIRLSEGGDPVEALCWFLVEVAQFVEDNGSLLCEGMGQMEAMGLGHPAHLWWRQTIRALLVQTGRPMDVDYTADMLYVMLDVHVAYFQRKVMGYGSTQIINGLLNTVMRLLA
ncbi:MAG: TetR/AcrR family transcriptional regulator [Chloroflexi bacterium]|nr:TetR/AcrR family transcriptional regulator [Chloroflexota bacterium]NOG62090.1 TetR/AcrR family transcriptional regulator [Chloroflexota bacterium]